MHAKRNTGLLFILAISLSFLSGCQKQIEGWGGIYYPSGETKDGFEVMSFKTGEECEQWANEKMLGSIEKGSHYLCGYNCEYSESGDAGCETPSENPPLNTSAQMKVDPQDYIKGGKFTEPNIGLSFNLPTDENYYMEAAPSEDEEGKIISYRIQNYMPEDKLGLEKNEFYIELWVHRGAQKDLADCQNLTSMETKQVNGETQVMGYPDQGGDSGGERYAFCSAGTDYNYYLQITDRNPEHPVRELIKESLKYDQ